MNPISLKRRRSLNPTNAVSLPRAPKKQRPLDLTRETESNPSQGTAYLSISDALATNPVTSETPSPSNNLTLQNIPPSPVSATLSTPSNSSPMTMSPLPEDSDLLVKMPVPPEPPSASTSSSTAESREASSSPASSSTLSTPPTPNSPSPATMFRSPQTSDKLVPPTAPVPSPEDILKENNTIDSELVQCMSRLRIVSESKALDTDRYNSNRPTPF